MASRPSLRASHSLSGTPSGNYSVLSSSTETDVRAQKFGDGAGFLKNIAHFKKVKRNDKFLMKSSWSGINIIPTTKAQLDMRILAQRVKHILENAIMQARIISLVSKLIENDAELLRSWMHKEDVQFVLQSIEEADASYTSKHIKTVTGYVVENNLQVAFRMLTTNKCILLYVTKYQPELSPYIRLFVNTMTDFSNLLQKYMEKTAFESAEKNKAIRYMYDQMRERKAELRRYLEAMNENQIEHNQKETRKKEQLLEMERRINDIKLEYDLKMQECLHNSDKLLYQYGEASVALQSDLSDVAKTSYAAYSVLKNQHIIEERGMRSLRSKLEAQLAIWLAKYDADIGEKQTHFEELSEMFESERRDMQELECLLLEQNKIFLRYKAEKKREADDEAFEHMFSNESDAGILATRGAGKEHSSGKRKRREKTGKQLKNVKNAQRKLPTK